MFLRSARVTQFKSIEDSSEVAIEEGVTVLVGKNESGKTAFLQALSKSRDIQKTAKYDQISDYPRKNLNRIATIHGDKPIEVLVLSYSLNDEEKEAIKSTFGVELPEDFTFAVTHNYSNDSSISLAVDQKGFIERLISEAGLTKDLEVKLLNTQGIRALLQELEGSDKNEAEDAFFKAQKDRFPPDKDPKWANLLAYKIWESCLSAQLPYFFYFDDYYLLPGKVNLNSLAGRITAHTLTEGDKTVLSLLRLADVELDELRAKSAYESSKAKLEGISNDISDKILQYWPNPDLSVEFDVDVDPKDSAPFNDGQNLYIRIRNSRHRVTLPFSQRSRGFVWFFSFIVWFDVIQAQLGTEDELILLLDEPGLNLHGLAQNDLLRYLDDLSNEHQVIYTTHSPFMVDSSCLGAVRTVEDRIDVGTIISSDLRGNDKDTLFPLQAALGYTIAQNLFISEKNLLVEGPADLIYLSHLSSCLSAVGREGLREDVTVVPTGGLDKVATFIALLKGNNLDLVVVHDYAKGPDQRLEDMVRTKIIESKRILNYALFMDGNKAKLPATDVEDMFDIGEYLAFFNCAYERELGGKKLTPEALPNGERIIARIEALLISLGLKVRPRGGFNHYHVANSFVTHLSEMPKPSEATLSRYEKLFAKVNSLF
jgi:energy-coupling factor transporter ATP-binding protein EcfA2